MILLVLAFSSTLVAVLKASSASFNRVGRCCKGKPSLQSITTRGRYSWLSSGNSSASGVAWTKPISLLLWLSQNTKVNGRPRSYIVYVLSAVASFWWSIMVKGAEHSATPLEWNVNAASVHQHPYYQPSSPNNLPLSTCIETYQVVNDVPLDNKVRNEHDDPFTDLQLGLCEWMDV